MAFIITGDTHGLLDTEKLTDYFDAYEGTYTKDDYLIILGDAGIAWSAYSDFKTLCFFNELPVTVLFVDGNHENHFELSEYPEELWNGGKVHFISDTVIHLMRGQVFTIDGLKFFTFGGGYSIDRAYRREGVTWWPEEMPSGWEYEEGLRNLEKNGWEVDYVLTHTCPSFIAEQLVPYLYSGEEALQDYFRDISIRISYKHWYFGHWHMDVNIDDFTCMYEDVRELE